MVVVLVAASDPEVEEVAQAVAVDGGSCIDVVVVGFFVVAGADAAVLLGPAVAIFGGVGMSARCLDGRALQPGRGVARPRGVLADQPVPPGSFGATPRTVPTVALLHSYGATRTLAQLVRPGIRRAKGCGASRRAALLETIARHGAGAYR